MQGTRNETSAEFVFVWRHRRRYGAAAAAGALRSASSPPVRSVPSSLAPPAVKLYCSNFHSTRRGKRLYIGTYIIIHDPVKGSMRYVPRLKRCWTDMDVDARTLEYPIGAIYIHAIHWVTGHVRRTKARLGAQHSAQRNFAAVLGHSTS